MVICLDKNSAAMIKSGDAYANKICNEYNRTAMTAFPQLTDEDIANILAYTAAKTRTSCSQKQLLLLEAGRRLSNKLFLEL